MRLHEVGVSHRGGFGHPIPLDYRRRQRFLNPQLHILRKRGRAEESHSERGQVGVPHRRILCESQPDRRHREQHCNSMSRHETQEFVHVETSHHYLRRARSYRAVHQHVHSVDMKQRQVRQDDVVLRQRGFLSLSRHELSDVRGEVVVGKHHPLGQSGSPGRVGKRRQVALRVYLYVGRRVRRAFQESPER